MPALDHTVYPCLIDMIVEGCDIDSMRALRTTSTAFRTRMDSLLNLHVELVLNQESKGLYMLLSGPRGSCESPSLRRPDITCSQRQLVKVADLTARSLGCGNNGSAVHPQLVRHALEALSSLHTLRRVGNAAIACDGVDSARWVLPSVETVVDFLSINLPPREYATRFNPYPLPQVKKYVLHIRARSNPTAKAEDRDFYPPLAKLKLIDLVLVLHPPGEPAMLGMARTVMAARYTITYLLGRFSHRGGWPDGGSITIVGMEGWQPGPSGQHHVARVLLNSHLAPLQYRFDNKLPAVDTHPHVPPKTIWMTMDDWLQSLGSKKHVEGVWPEAG